ncbi:MAG: hypothetical protein BMS9Abin05_1854 [Rhodothermia bacterium]|nr:MAG: hypothetical protein BMS9Abin05_1854 [Rhodothermia bacterium]
MRYLVHIAIPHEPFNSYVRDGSAGQKIGRILEETKPEAIYFTEEDGTRGATAVYHIENASDVPSIAEPWFLTYEAECRFRMAMSPEDLQNAGLDELGQKWG